MNSDTTRSLRRAMVVMVLVVCCGFLGWWMVRDLERAMQKPKKSAPPVTVRHMSAAAEPEPPRRERPVADTFADGTTVEMLASSKPQQVILRFPSEESYLHFIEAVNDSPVTLLGRLDRMRAMRLGYGEPEDLSRLLDGENLTISHSLSSIPDRSLPETGAQEDAVGFGGGLLSWLGIEGDISRWGAGVKIAVLDTGVVPHASLPGLKESIAVVPFPEDLAQIHGHGTAVASLIAGNHAIAPGIAPAAELISVRISDETGVTDSYATAEGLLAAADAGAQIINLSMGAYENSPLTEEAVRYVQSQGILVVAAAGNDGLSDARYPASYPDVISVGAVDARGIHLDFSNYGEYLYLTAPGYLVNVAWPGESYVRISGTSASAPVVTGAIAALMSQGAGRKMSASEAADLILKHTDDAGIPGPDSQYGIGVLNLARVLRRNQPGLVDAAIADQRLVPTSDGAGQAIQVTIQNRGTASLINTLVEITLHGSAGQKFNVTSLEPGAIQSFTVPVGAAHAAQDGSIEVTTRLVLSTQVPDQTPANNQRTERFRLPRN